MCSMKCETPAFASVSSRDPAPIQNPIATERTLGTRSEITRSPLSSSEKTYFWITPALSRRRGMTAMPRPPARPPAARGELAERRDEVAVGLEQLVDELVDLGERQLGAGVRVEHGRVVDMVAPAGQGCLHCQRLDADVRLDQCGQLRRQRPDGFRGDSARVCEARHLDAALRREVR